MKRTEMDDDVARLSVMFDEFARTHCEREPVYAALCSLVARTPRFLRLLRGAPSQQQRPNLLLAAVQFVVRRESCALGAYFPSAGGERAVDAAFDGSASAFIEANAARIEAAVGQVLADGCRGADLGGTMGTTALGDAVVSALNGRGR